MTAPLPNIGFGGRRVPLVLQTEAAECGLACLAMVAGYHRLHLDMRYLRGRFSVSMKGSTLQQMVSIATQLKMTSRPLKLELDELASLRLPCILHWNLNHFVVLCKATPTRLVIHDPALGLRKLSYAQASAAFTGIALELDPAIAFVPAKHVQKFRLGALITSVGGLWRSLAIVLGMALVLEAFALLGPLFNQWVVDEALTSNDRELLNVLVCAFALMQLTQTAISLARGWTILYLSTHLGLQWSANLFTHLMRLPSEWFEKRHLGDVVSRFGSMGAIQKTLTTGFISTLIDGLMAVATLAMMVFYSGPLTMLVVGAVLLYALVRVGSYYPLRVANGEALQLGAREQSCFLESIRAVQPIKLFCSEDDRRSRWLGALVDSVNRGVRTQKFNLVIGLANTFIFGIEALLLFWVGARMVMDGSYTVGMLFAFTSYGSQFTGRMSALIDRAIEFRMLSLQCERLADIVLEPPEQPGSMPGGIDHLAASLELVDVAFRYGDDEPFLLRHLNLKVDAGEVLAITGPSGCGKTTLLKIMLGLLKPVEGYVAYGGVRLEQIGPAAYRGAVATVMQNDQLLSGSLAENVGFFAPVLEKTRIEECCAMAGIHDDIEAMPMGYQTLTGDMGTTLSGGQKQRLMLARALYKRPKLLFLDEATSHLDIDNERHVNAAIRALPITRICVAHRPETIALASRVVRLDGGVIQFDSAAQLPVAAAAATLP